MSTAAQRARAWRYDPNPAAPLAAAAERRSERLRKQSEQQRAQRGWDSGFAQMVRINPETAATLFSKEGAPKPKPVLSGGRRRPKGSTGANKGGRPLALNPKQVERAIELACCGWSQRKIAMFLKVHEDTIKRRLREPEAKARIAEFKAKVQGDVELAICEFEDAKELAKHSRKPLTPEQLIEHIGEMALAEAIVATAPPLQPAPEPPKPEVRYLSHYFVPPVAATSPRDPWAEPQRLYNPAAAKVRDWRSLPIPDMWARKPAPPKPQPTPMLYGTRYQSSK